MVPRMIVTAMPIRTELEDVFIARFLRYGDEWGGSMVGANKRDLNHIFSYNFGPVLETASSVV